ncbi:MAG: flagellar biosynthetic protein FliR, partial [Pirellulales bacterium]|nr:flagellar biosynthetic protein FliR [Pirellulales bacterium]
LLWPIGSFFPSFSDDFPEIFGRVFAELIMTIVLLAAPVIITLFVSEFGLGMINRFAPQLNVFFLAMPLKCLIALFVLIFYLPILMSLLRNEAIAFEAILEQLKAVMS